MAIIAIIGIKISLGIIITLETMDIIQPVIFGAVQGLAEFLPISSSAHLLLLHSVTYFSVGSDLSFDVALHLGTLLALLIFF